MSVRSVIRFSIASVVFATGFIFPIETNASVVIAATRVIYDAAEPEVTVKLSNNGELPALAQTWLDKGDPQSKPETVDVPFTVSPPIARIDPGKSQTLRITYTGEALPQDRESVLYLNMLEVPPKAKAAANKLELAFRTRIKFFFRPTGLPGSAMAAPGQLTWTLNHEPDHPAITVHNPSAFHVSVTNVAVTNAGKTAKNDEGFMVAPGETSVVPLKGEVSASAEAKVSYRAINDFGGELAGETALTSETK